MIKFEYKGKVCEYAINEIAYFDKYVVKDVVRNEWIARIALTSIFPKYQNANQDIWLLAKAFKTEKYAEQWADSIIDTLLENRVNFLNGELDSIKDIEFKNLAFIVELDSMNEIKSYEEKKCNGKCGSCKG